MRAPLQSKPFTPEKHDERSSIQHRAKATPPMLPQPPQANFRASERSQEEHDAKAASEAQAYKDQRIANIAKKKKGEEARVASDQAAAS